MDNLQKLISEITQLTNTIETRYPELYIYLDENPMTIPSEKEPTINKKVLQEYLESLNQLLKNHLETRNKTAKHN